MRSPARRARPLLAVACLLSFGCTESGVAPDAAPPREEAGANASLIGSLLGQPILVNVLQRLSPLPRSYSASAVVGQGGGTLSIPQAGFSITFPPGAIRGAPVTVRATALAGNNVAYRLEPHGLTFGTSPVITQELGVTQALLGLLNLGGLEGAYFPSDAALGKGTALVTELRPATMDLLRFRMRFDIRHFSGYAASSRRGGYIAASGDRIGTGGPTIDGH
ncbi:MAG TPA: hypothetical protein VFX98_13245 [Longimicrobiaceae bacterium]|nr:hypothetical protein [Longimicrobiaceae bacterium]